MRPHKHVTARRSDAQEVFEISLARMGNKPGRPFITTAEREEITLYGWDENGSVWRGARIGHAPIDVERGVPSISNTWNWSRRVGLTTLDDQAYLVYKRAPAVAEDEKAQPPQLVLETFSMDANGFLRRELRVPVPMPTYIREDPGPPPRLTRVSEKPGFELWTGLDIQRRKLLIVTQTLGERATAEGGNALLTLLLGDLDQLDQVGGWESRVLDEGGYGLDVRHQGDTLTFAYRATPESLRVPLPTVGIDPFFGSWPQAEIDASASSDRFFEPLRIMRVDLGSMNRTTLELPGGEHPRIQNVDPLMIVIDRPQLRVRFRVLVTPQEGTVPLVEPQIDWEISGIHKLSFLLNDQDRIARGVLLSIPQGTRLSLPRTVSPWVNVQDLYQITPQNVRWASIWPRFPLEPLGFNAEPRELFFDFLHKAPWFALQRSRARLTADFADGELTVTDLDTAVYDINHDQIVRPNSLTPDTSGENAQFAPFEQLSQQSGTPVRAPSYQCDNTIGGSLVTDREGMPYQFVSYTDLGDGGLRVVFDADLGPPDEPPPIKDPKRVEPESVPGPGSGDERWIELETTDWQNAGVPRIALLDLISQSTLTSAMHCQIESLLSAGFSLAGLTVDENGWSEDEINSIQTEIDAQFNSANPVTIFSTDGTVPRAFIRITPPTVVADANAILEAGIEGEPVNAVEWVFTLQAAAGVPLIVNASGNPVTVTPIVAGNWTVSADITRIDGSLRSFQTVVAVGESLFRRISGIHRRLSDRGLDPPLDNFGDYRIGTATFNLLQYELRFPVDLDESGTHRIVINALDATDAQWRFVPNATDQGLIDYRLRIRFESTDFRLEGILSTLMKLESVKASFFYGRAFTPGILMNDTRSAVPLTGLEQSNDGLRLSDDSASLPRLASALTARPLANSLITIEDVKVDVSMLPQAAGAAVVTLLIGLAATAAATTLLFLLAALGIAIAVAAVPLAGTVAAAAVVAAAVAVFLFITFVVPPIVEAAIADSLKRGLTNNESMENMDESRLLQFAGEGVAEAIARQVIEKAIAGGAAIDQPPVASEEIGRDRYRQHLYQMIHVSEGRCRVLIRA